MVYVVSGRANLHKTHVNNVGYNLCDPNAVETKGFDVKCSLVCFLKQPYISGVVTFKTYKEDCDGNPVGTRLHAPNSFMILIGCPSDYEEGSLMNNTWVGTASHTTSQGVDLLGNPAGYRLKFNAVMTANYSGTLSLSIDTARLMPGSLEYVSCNSISMELTEIVTTDDGDYGRNYESELIPTTFNDDECGGEVKYVKAEIALISYHFGCATDYVPSAPKCNLRTDRGGFIREYSCLVVLASPSDRVSWRPQVSQLGINSPECDEGNDCGCYYYDGVAISPARENKSEVLNIGCPDENFSSRKQRIQSGYVGVSGLGRYEIILKTVGVGSICVAVRLVGNTTGPWVIGSLSVVQAVGPLVMVADFSGLLAGNPVFQFYGAEFPSADIEDCVNALTGPPPMEPHDAPHRQFINAPSSQKSAPIPSPSSQNLEMVKAREMVKKIYEVKARPCVNLGMALEAAPSCGCGGGILHECSIHGECRQAGNDTKKKLCWKCDDYSPK